jgi:MtN3 and saliva related transmembrane protein
MEYIGIIGLLAIAAGWIPQTLETIRLKRCNINYPFLTLNLIGSLALIAYACLLNDLVFTILNSMTAFGAVINLFYKIRTVKRVNT